MSSSSEGFAALLNSLQIEYPKRGFVSTAPAGRWEDGLILGNGRQGALCFSQPHNEEIVLSHESLFLPVYPKHEYIHLAPHLEHIRELVLDNRGADAMRLTIDLAKEKGYIQRELTDPFIGACALKIETGGKGFTQYARSVNFETADSVVAWRDESGLFHRRVFASRAHDLIVVEFKNMNGAHVNASFELSRIERDLDEDFYSKAVAETLRESGPGFLSFRVKLRRITEDQKLIGYCVGMRAVAVNGQAQVCGHILKVSDADKILLLIEVRPEFAGREVIPACLRKRLDCVMADYDQLLAEHAVKHSELFGRVSVSLGDRQEEQCPTEVLKGKSRVGSTDVALVQKAFDAGRYGTICSTGRLPPALQGIWTGTWRPNWSGDFTLNGNLQTAIASALPGGYFECVRSALDYLSSLLDDFRTNASELFGFRGIYVPWRSSTHGQCHYAGAGRGDGSGAFPGMYWFAGTAWWAWFYYDYWLYTGDNDFFKEQLVPYFRESADFFEDYLSVERDGKLVLVPTYSPENAPAGAHCLQPNATMTVACLKQFFRTALKISDRLGVDDARRLKWQSILSRLPGYRIDPSGALAEWAWPGVANNENHRHASHLYPLYDGVAPEIENDPALREACRVAIEKRLEYRRPKGGAEMAFGIFQLAMAAAYLRDSRLAYECVEWLVNSYWSPAMVSQHDPGKILNLDISGGLPAIIMNMLVQSFEPQEQGGAWRISVLPCLPEAWPNGSISGIRCRGGFEVAVQWKAHGVADLKVTSLRGQRFVVEHSGRKESPVVADGETWCAALGS